jgi:hypothetical protein
MINYVVALRTSDNTIFACQEYNSEEIKELISENMAQNAQNENVGVTIQYMTDEELKTLS